MHHLNSLSKHRFLTIYSCSTGCSDESGVAIDERERPRLETRLILDYVGAGYHIHVPIRSDARGVVYVDDVIPKGLASGSTKK
jgi:hypothetical protein